MNESTTKQALPPWQRGRSAFRDWLSASWKVIQPSPTEGQKYWGQSSKRWSKVAKANVPGWFADTRAALRKVETYDDAKARNQAKRARKAVRA